MEADVLPAAPAVGAPDRSRRGIVGFAVTLAIITYVDRICLMKARDFIQADLKISDAGMGWVFAVFPLTYGLFEVPWGWLGDRIGPKKVLLRIVVAWSFFTAATGWTWNLASLLVTRALFGVGEAGCFPNLTKAFSTRLPRGERVRAQGVLWLSARWGGAFTPLLVVWIMALTSWRRTFEIFGAIGLIWALVFWWKYREERTAPAPAGLSHADRRFWGLLFASPRVWLLCLQYFLMNYGAYLYVTWLPKFFKDKWGVGGDLAAVLDGTPLFFMGLGSLAAGLFLGRASGAVWRKRFAIAGYLASFAFILLAAGMPGPVAAALMLGLAGFASDLVMPASWGASMDMGGRYAGTLSAFMNMMGCLGAGLFPVVAPRLMAATGDNWTLVLVLNAVAYLAAAACWLVLDTETPLIPEETRA
jgi:ACS family glucarate transporter-like MFS transporter